MRLEDGPNPMYHYGLDSHHLLSPDPGQGKQFILGFKHLELMSAEIIL